MDSSLISIDLRNNVSIPKLAKVRSITTSSTQTPSQRNVLHKIMSAQKINDWYTSTVTSATSGLFHSHQVNEGIGKYPKEQCKIGYFSTNMLNLMAMGSYSISLQNQLFVAQKCGFKYNAKATAKSTITNVHATINYEYDVTDKF